MALELLLLLSLYQAVSGRLSWLDTRMPPANQARSPTDDLFASLLNDMNLDISFNEPPPNDFVIDDSPSSMFSSLPSFLRTPFSGPRFSRSPKPLFLLMQSQPQPQYQSVASAPVQSRSVFSLTQTDRVTGNTVRFTMRSHGDERQFTRESFAAPNFFLCDNSDCDENDGIEMMNVLEDFLGDAQSQYLHLVPTTPAPVEWLTMPEADDATWMDAAMGALRGCHEGLSQWYYGEPTADDAQVEGHVVVIEEVELAQDAQPVSSQSEADAEDVHVLLLAMNAVMLSVVLCGVVFVAHRCLVDRKREVWRAEDYVAMHETDGF